MMSYRRIILWRIIYTERITEIWQFYREKIHLNIMSVPRGTLQRIMLASRPGDDNISRCGIVIILCSQNDPKIKLCAGNYWLTNTYVNTYENICFSQNAHVRKKSDCHYLRSNINPNLWCRHHFMFVCSKNGAKRK